MTTTDTKTSPVFPTKTLGDPATVTGIPNAGLALAALMTVHDLPAPVSVTFTHPTTARVVADVSVADAGDADRWHAALGITELTDRPYDFHTHRRGEAVFQDVVFRVHHITHRLSVVPS